MNSRSDVIFTPSKFTWADFGGINTDIHPRRYAPAGLTRKSKITGRPNSLDLETVV